VGLPSTGVGFFADEPMIGKRLPDDPPDFLLRCVVGLRDEIAWPLVRGLEAADPIEKDSATRTGSSLTHSKGFFRIQRAHSIQARRRRSVWYVIEYRRGRENFS
jgi:hypothetical protein